MSVLGSERKENRHKMSRTKKHNAVRERLSFSCSPQLKGRILAVAGEMNERSFSAAMRRILIDGLVSSEQRYGLAQQNLFPDKEEMRAEV